MYRSVCLFAYIALALELPGSLAAPGLPKSNLNKRWFTINPQAGGTQFWPGHQLKYKFKNDDSKDKLKDIVKAGWKLWTDNGLDKANIDLVETPDGGDNDVLTIEVSSDPRAMTTVGFSGGARMVFGEGDSFGFLDTHVNMAHELGHALGFYHEHQRFDRNDHVVFNCKNLQDYSEDREKEGFCTDLMAASLQGWSSAQFIPYGQYNFCIASDAYDEDSIMHYSGGAGAKKPLIGHRKTVLGTKVDPKTSFKKNMKPSATDIDRANAMYSGQGNQKRDGDCATAQGGQQSDPNPNPPDPEDAEEAQEDAEDAQEDAEEEADDGDDD